MLTGRELVLTLISFAALLEAASPKPRRDLADHFAAALNSLGGSVLPADRQGRVPLMTFSEQLY